TDFWIPDFFTFEFFIDDSSDCEYIRFVFQYFVFGVKFLMSHQLHAVGIKQQSIAGDTCCRLVSFRKTAVDNNQLASALIGFSPSFSLTGVCPFIIWPSSGSKWNSFKKTFAISGCSRK